MEHEKLQKAESQAKQQELNLTGIPTQMKWDLEARSGLSLDDVRVHYHSDKPAKLGALAYTQGTQVHIGPGQEGHLRHELGHVVQQKLGLVRPNAWYPGGLALNTEEALERQADVIGTGSYCQPLLSAGMPPVQRFEDPVVQAQGHITLEKKEGEDHPKTQADAISLPDTSWPTIVFEAMGVTAEDCEEVYKQTKLYEGNTICVFGLNTETKDASTFKNKKEALEEYQKKVDNDNDKDTVQHLLYTFSFQWTPPSNKKDGYYRMPFVEARILVMQKAAEIVAGLQKPDGNPDHKQYKFLYRWIDADARDDDTTSLGSDQLIDLADERGAAVMTGRYDWRSMVTEDNKIQIQTYKDFIKEFNKVEKELREYYYELSRTFSEEERIKILKKDLINRILTLQDRASLGDDERQEIARIGPIVYGLSRNNYKATTLAEINSNGYLPGYYYPESTLMMNQIAHDKIAGLYPVGGNPDKVLKSIGAVDKEQDKESMRMLTLLKPHIIFETKLKVTKPLKNEFDDGTYWGKDMLAFLREPQDQAAFIVALKNVRQSAFDPGLWYFIREDPWNKWEVPNRNIEDSLEAKQELFNRKRREWAEKLFQFLDSKDDRGETNKQKIAREIASGSGGQGKTNQQNTATGKTPVGPGQKKK